MIKNVLLSLRLIKQYSNGTKNVFYNNIVATLLGKKPKLNKN